MSRTTPTPPIELTGTSARWPSAVTVPGSVISELAAIAPVTSDDTATAEASRDWWPLALHWSLAGAVPCRGAAVCQPSSTRQVAAITAICNHHRIPLTVVAGRSGVSGGAVPAFGGVLLDLTGLRGVGTVDRESGVVEVAAGTFGPELEAALANHDLSVGHFPAELRPVHGRWLGRLSRRRAVLDPLREDRGSRRRPRGRSRRRPSGLHRRRPSGCCRSRPQPVVRRIGGHVGDRHPSVATNPSTAAGRTTRGLPLFVVLRGDRAVPADPPQRSDAGGPAALRRVRVARGRASRRRDELHVDRPRRRRAGARRGDDGDRRQSLRSRRRSARR